MNEFLFSKKILKINFPKIGILVFSFILGIPLWIILSFFARTILPWNIIGIPVTEWVLLSLAGFLSYFTVKSIKDVLFETEEQTISIRVNFLALALLLCSPIIWDITASYYHNYYESIQTMNLLGRFGQINSDFALHISYSQFLLSHALFTGHPLYAGATTITNLFFDLYVASIARLFSMSPTSVFYLLTPVPVLFAIAGFLMVMISEVKRYSAVAIFVLILGFYFCVKLNITYPYMLYALFYIFVLLYLIAKVGAAIIDGKINSSRVGLLSSFSMFICLFFMSELKVLIFIGLAGVLALFIAYMTIILFIRKNNFHYEMKVVFTVFVLPLIIVSILFYFIVISKSSIPIYVPTIPSLAEPSLAFAAFSKLKILIYKIPEHHFQNIALFILDHFTTLPSLLLLLRDLSPVFFWLSLLWIIRNQYKKGNHIINFNTFLGLFFILGFFSAIIYTFYPKFFTAMMYDGGALIYYPKWSSEMVISISCFFLVIIIQSLKIKSPRAIINYLVLLIPVLYIYIFLYKPYPGLLWKPLDSIKKEYFISPDRNVLEGIDFLNNINRKSGEIQILTSYWDLNRNYNFSMYSIHAPFLSSWQYGFINLQPDYGRRKEISELLFITGDLAKFIKIVKSEYPKLKYIFIDNAIIKDYYPGEPGPEIWQSHIYSDLPVEKLRSLGSLLTINKSDKMLQVIHNQSYPNDTYIHSVNSIINKGLLLGIIEKVFSNEGCSIYMIK